MSRHSIILLSIGIGLSGMALPSVADNMYFFWYGTAPDSVAWAPFNWEEQERTSGFATAVQAGSFFDHTPDAGDDEELNRSLTFTLDAAGNQGAHHPTVLPQGIGSVSLWVYYDLDTGIGGNGEANSIYLSKNPGTGLVSDNYLGVIMAVGSENFQVVSKANPSGVEGPALKANDWNHLVFTDDGQSTQLQINDTDSGLSLTTGGNLVFINIVDGIVQTDGTIQNGDCPETFYIDDIECRSDLASGIETVQAPRTSNTITIDGVINPAEIQGAYPISWNGSTTERPGVHAQFYGDWELPAPEDMTATAYLQNNGDKLYISIDVKDNVVHVTGNSSWWEEDSTELYIDHDNSRSTSGAAQVSLNADNTFNNADTFADWLVITSEIKPDQSGWQVEAEINMAARELSADQTYGFDLSVNDSDGENEAGFQDTQEWLFASFETAYYNETYWGILHILSTPLTSVWDWNLR